MLSAPVGAYDARMEALIERLSHLDSEVEGALRVVVFYDTLVQRRVDLPALARSSAGLAECVVGIRLTGSAREIRMAPGGHPASEAMVPVSRAAPVTLDGEEIGTVWLERAGGSLPLDEVVLDRLAIAVAAVAERYGPASTTLADPALVELIIGEDTDDGARARALRLLGFAADLPVRIAAVRSRTPMDQVARSVCPSRPVKAAVLADVGVVVATILDPAAFPPGTRAGLGVAPEPAVAWQQARTALRFATPHDPVVDHAGLGSLALLAGVPEADLRANPDVAAIHRLATRPEDLETLEAYCLTGSLRRAAAHLHRHHSSVARRMEQLSSRTGIALGEPSGLLRARLALTAWRLLRP